MSRDEVRKIERTIYKNAGIDMEDEDKNDEDEKQDKDESSDESDDEDIVEKDNLAKVKMLY